MSPPGRLDNLPAGKQLRGAPSCPFGLGEGQERTAVPREESVADKRTPVFRLGEDSRASCPNGVQWRERADL